MILTTDLILLHQTATLILKGEINTHTATLFRDAINQVPAASIHRLILDMTELTYLSSAGLRVLIFAKQKMGSAIEMSIVGAPDNVLNTIKQVGFHHSIHLQSHT